MQPRSKHTPTPHFQSTLSILLTAREKPKEDLSIPGVIQENLELTPPSHSLDTHQKLKTLRAPSLNKTRRTVDPK